MSLIPIPNRYEMSVATNVFVSAVQRTKEGGREERERAENPTKIAIQTRDDGEYDWRARAFSM